jgi:predicted nucleic acid-binding protein
MRKLKLYLDTSVISHLFANDTPERMDDTIKFWNELRAEKFEVYTSDTVQAEISKCKQERRKLLESKLAEISHRVLGVDDEVVQLAGQYISNKILPNGSVDDSFHIAFAVIAGCDYIVSWNFRHMVNVRTINGVKVVNTLNNYKEIGIITPSMLL